VAVRDRLKWNPLSGYRTKKYAVTAHLSMLYNEYADPPEAKVNIFKKDVSQVSFRGRQPTDAKWTGQITFPALLLNHGLLFHR
jgi:hypothetical protein